MKNKNLSSIWSAFKPAGFYKAKLPACHHHFSAEVPEEFVEDKYG